MKIAVFATGEFAVPIIKYLKEKGELVLVFTKTDKPKGRGMKLRPTPVAEIVGDDIPVVKADKLNRRLFEEYLSHGVDMALVIDYGIYIPSYFYGDDAPFMVNIHPSLLPRWRGPAPIQWTIYSGDTKTGITFHKVAKEIDAGDILYQVEYSLTGREKATQLEEILAYKVPHVWDEFLSLYKNGKIEPIPQGDDYTYAPMFDKAMFHIDFHKSCDAVDRLVRSLADVPGAYGIFRGKRVKILYGECQSERASEEAGSVVWIDKDKFGIQTGDGVYVPLELKPEGKKVMSVADFIRGYKPEVGDIWY